jgi:serine phosphatase RsbU (regulator of sigma subunit)
VKAPRPLARPSSPAALEVDEDIDPGPLSRAVLVGEGVPPRIRAAIEGQAQVETWGLADIFDVGARSPDLLLLYAGLPEAALREALARLGPRSRPGRPTVLMACSPDVPAPAALLDEVDEIINDVMKDAELQLRLRAVLRARGALLALQRKNAELEGLYARVEVLAGRMAEELRLASQVQRSLLPPPFSHPRLDVAREYIPVREIGGDYYDLLPLDEDRVVFALGDVMGKGVPAALLAANLKACLRAHLQTGVLAPAELIARVNRLFWEVTPKGLFASLFFGVLDLGRGVLEFVNAGHDHPFLVRGDGSLRDLDDGGTVLGLLEDSRYERGAVAVEAGDFLVLFSDGLTDRSNLAGELYGVGRLKEAARSNRGSSARLLLYSLLGEVQGFSAGEPATDDATLIVAQVR